MEMNLPYRMDNLTGAPLEVPATQAVQVQRIMEAAYRSNDEGKIVKL